MDPSARLVQPEGVNLAIVAVSPALLLLSILTVAGLLYVETTEKVTSTIADIACAVLPGVLLWTTQLILRLSLWSLL